MNEVSDEQIHLHLCCLVSQGLKREDTERRLLKPNTNERKMVIPPFFPFSLLPLPSEKQRSEHLMKRRIDKQRERAN